MKLSANGKRIGRPPIFTPEERAIRDAEKRRERDRLRLKRLTEEQKERRRVADSKYKRNRPKTEELLQRQRAATAKSRAKRAAEMTPEEREIERAKKKAYNQSYELSERQRRERDDAARAWTKANPERVAAARVEWQKKNPDAYRIYAQNRRARKRAQAGQLSVDIADRLMELQRGKCAACKCALNGKHELDHVIPLAAGGEHADRNLQLLCRDCNRRKGTKHPVDFMQSKGMLL